MHKIEKSGFVGKKVVDAMTSNQLVSLIDALFYLMDDDKINTLLSGVDKDISSTLAGILNPHKEDSKPPVTDSKYWEKLWGEWDDIIFELGDESGQYVYNEHHWETPYFDGCALSDDLEEISKELLPLIEKMYNLNIEEDDYFWKVLKDIDNGIDSYPEWMGVDYSECILGHFTTNCILEWEWFVASSKENPAEIFIERISAIDSTLKTVELDSDTFIDFFASLSRDTKKQIYKNINAARGNPIWQERLQCIYSKWHKIYHSLLSLFNSKEYFSNCLKYLPENWAYGLPLIKNLLKQQKYTEAEKIAKRTFSALLKLKNDKVWLPEKSLLINELYYYNIDSDETVIELLQDWTLIAEKTENKERAAILPAQLAVYKNSYDLDGVTEIFKRLINSSHSNIAKALFKQWQDFIVKRSVFSYIEGNHEELHDSWIHWLVEIGIEDARDKQWFIDKVTSWLKFLTENQNQFKKFYSYIFTLTGDLSHIAQLEKRYPALCRIVGDNGSVQPDCAIARQKRLKDLEADKILPDIIKCWEKNVAGMVPDPSKAIKSDYTNQARWLLAVHEIDQQTYREIIEQWKIDHKRRINLWKAIDEAGLSDYL